MKVFIDLCTSLGGASKAFDEDPSWRTIKIDNAEYLLDHHKGMILQDVTDVPGTLKIIRQLLDDWGFDHKTDTLVVWASPPCQQFSFANASRDPKSFDFTILEACMDIIDNLQWDYWVIENVRGAVPTFTEILEHYPRQMIGPLMLWGHFPLLSFRGRAHENHRKMEAKGSRLLRPHNRSLVPEAVSQALRDAIDCQTNLWRWTE